MSWEGGTGAPPPYSKNPQPLSLGVPRSSSHTPSPCPLDEGTQTNPDVSLAGLILNLILLSTETLAPLHTTALSTENSAGAEQAAHSPPPSTPISIPPPPEAHSLAESTQLLNRNGPCPQRQLCAVIAEQPQLCAAGSCGPHLLLSGWAAPRLLPKSRSVCCQHGLGSSAGIHRVQALPAPGLE